MAPKKRVGLWFAPGLEHALAARAALGELQAQHPNSDWVLFGPRSSLFLFEMDERVPVYIPLRALEPRRAAQSRLSYFLEKRAQFKKLRGLELDLCFAVVVVAPNHSMLAGVQKQFRALQNALGVGSNLIQKTLPEFLAADRPLLQAGPESLAFATRLHRNSPPDQPKTLVLLMAGEDGADSIEAQFQAINSTAEFNSLPAPTIAVLTTGDRLLARQLSHKHPNWLQLDVAQAMGLIAYADRVICTSGQITRICAEMGRLDRVLLGKSDS